MVGEGQWSLYWTARGAPVPCQLVPALAGWADLDRREMAADIGSRHPILIDPESRIDPVLARFLAWSRFAWLAEGTREAYALCRVLHNASDICPFIPNYLTLINSGGVNGQVTSLMTRL